MGDRHRNRSLTRGRLEAFSDGVFAIAATLLILDVQVPHPLAPGGLAGALFKLWPAYATYAASFLMIGIMWLNHHALCERLAAINRPLVLLNLLLLMTVSFLPFPTQILGQHISGTDASAAACFYSLSAAAIAIAFTAFYLYVGRHPELRGRDYVKVDFGAAAPWYTVGLFVYAACIGLSFVSPPLVVLLVGGVALYYVIDRLPEPVREDLGDDGDPSQEAATATPPGPTG